MKEWDVVCIVCPKGCRLKVTEENNEMSVTGNECKRGLAYGIKEVTNPTRVITSTVKVNHAIHRRMPIVTKGSVPKHMMFDVVKEINKIELELPIYMGDIIIENVLDTGINIVAARTIK
jgi:CxxC motif-containing protein